MTDAQRREAAERLLKDLDIAYPESHDEDLATILAFAREQQAAALGMVLDHIAEPDGVRDKWMEGLGEGCGWAFKIDEFLDWLRTRVGALRKGE